MMVVRTRLAAAIGDLRTDQLQGVGQDGAQEIEALLDSPGAARKIDDQRSAAQAAHGS